METLNTHTDHFVDRFHSQFGNQEASTINVKRGNMVSKSLAV
jgi:hypothetical protein